MTVRIEREVVLKATPSALWPIVSDTDRANRLLGQGEVTYTPNGKDSLARFTAETTIAFGITLRYQELPFEWEAPRRLQVRRIMEGSPLSEYTFGVSLREERDGTHVTLRFLADPRSPLARPLVRLLAEAFAVNYMRFLARADRFLSRPGIAPTLATTAEDHPFADPHTPSDEDELERRGAALRRLLRGANESATSQIQLERLLAFLRNAPDVDVMKMRPFELAEAWSAPRAEVLSTCLYGVQAGLVELRFAVICPSCMVPSDTVSQLEELGALGHCNQCDLSFDLDLDRAVEVNFRAHPAVRKLAERVFCLGSPARSPHVAEQRHFAVGASEILRAPREPGRYRLFLRGGASAAIEVDASVDAARVSLSFDDAQVTPSAVRLAPGAEICVQNAGTSARHGKIERLEYASLAATVHEVSVIPEFRRLCSADLLKSGTPLKVANVVLLFSDLTGSTQMYSTIGDAAAFRVVDDHFDVLRKAITAHGGTVIKTMGDAVMASFLDTPSALRAVVECLDDFEAWRRTLAEEVRIGLKLGVHAGPCYIITANGALDYFGQTVNVAARLQGLASSGECTMMREHYTNLPEAITRELTLARSSPAQLKGVDGQVDVVHLTRARRET